MSASVASDLDVPPPRRGGRIEKLALLATKLLVTGACFWYVSRQIDLHQAVSAVPRLDWRWAAGAVCIALLQIPIVALRWRNILDALPAQHQRLTNGVMTAISAIGIFFAQVLPMAAGEGVRAWLLVRRGCNWRNAVTSVVIDRGVGVALLMGFGLVALLLPSGLTALGGYRRVVLITYGALLLAGLGGLLLIPRLVPLLHGWRYSRWIASLAADVHAVLLGPRGWTILALGALIHALTIVIVCMVGWAQGLDLPWVDAAVLFTVMIGVVLVPISISGWGLREVAVISILGGYGDGPEQALLFSLCFGLVLAVGSLPGALALLFYSVGPARPAARPARG